MSSATTGHPIAPCLGIDYLVRLFPVDSHHLCAGRTPWYDLIFSTLLDTGRMDDLSGR